MKEKTISTVDPQEIEHFSRIASEWWNSSGQFKPLHLINPLRIRWIRDHVMRHFGCDSVVTQPLNGLTLLDIGCGGGLMCEPMRRLGAQVTGIDASEKNIAVAGLHAEQSGLDIDYRCVSAEELQAGGAQFDIVLALEIVEHVADIGAFVAATCGLLKPGGLIVYSTLNRTAKSYALAIIGAEYILRWVPRGTHSWKKFIRPSELCAQLRCCGITVKEMTGMVYRPLGGKWELDKHDLEVNYLVAGRN